MDVKRNAEGITATVEGMDQLKATLLALPDKIRRKVLLSALRKGAAVVRKALNNPLGPILSSRASSCLLYTTPSPRDRQKTHMTSTSYRKKNK